MIIDNYSAANLRSIDFISFVPGPNINLIVGQNNAGKTSILEGINVCSTLKSFKPVTTDSLVKGSKKELKIALNVTKNNDKHIISLEKSLKSSISIKYDEKRVSASKLSLSFPVIALSFGTENIINLGSDSRRSLLDWGAFHVEPSYLSLFKDYTKCLKQRNMLLRDKSSENLDYWTEKLCSFGESLNTKRKSYFVRLLDQYVHLINRFSVDKEVDIYDDIKNTTISYYHGWNGTPAMIDAVNLSIEKDRALKYTTVGPHRADIIITANNELLKQTSSMSTQVIVSLLLMLAQCQVFHVEHEYRPILLIDDLFFGIDDKNLRLVINLLRELGAQCFLTAPDLYHEKLKSLDLEGKDTNIYKLIDGKITQEKQ